MGLERDVQEKIADTIDASFDDQVALTSQFAAIPSTRGAEWPAQDFMASELRKRGYVIDDWQISLEDLAGLPDLGVIEHDFSRARTVVGTLKPPRETGRSIILQGHCDVVPAGPGKMWRSPPFQPIAIDGWLHGRGAADMKAGTIAALYAVDAIRTAGYSPKGRIHFQSVIEEESTGVGALSALQRGYRADCALLPEPTGQELSDVCLGVIWFRLKVSGEPTHVSRAGEGFNAIKAATKIIGALEELEREWNERAVNHPIYGKVTHPLNFNPGIIHGGDWASSVPSWCEVDCRIGLLPDWSVEQCQQEIVDCVKNAASKMAFLAGHPPEVQWSGFLSHGYVMRDEAIIRPVLEEAHKIVTKKPLERRLATSLNDARFYDRYFGIPAFCYGPVGQGIHGFNERVSLQSLRETTKTIANFIALWCGIEPT